jgi:hypothetical protein
MRLRPHRATRKYRRDLVILLALLFCPFLRYWVEAIVGPELIVT